VLGKKFARSQERLLCTGEKSTPGRENLFCISFARKRTARRSRKEKRPRSDSPRVQKEAHVKGLDGKAPGIEVKKRGVFDQERKKKMPDSGTPSGGDR